ncbi:Vitamin B12 ABC transporter, permease component BtuC [hydrothermal vent metagenome]|uniref:Vitamin B12 ABC transporter, permease component BtuC n=1 Tax=hydrothermal vent metagenome TaxID=652676 RepID=A0A3B0X924_9ZZZZ
MHRPLNLIFILLLLSIASFAFAISMGSMQLSFTQLSQALFSNDSSIAHTIIWELRTPRAYIAFISGGLLSLAGVLMQVLLRNPLADPYILGVSGGASVAALLAMSTGLAGGWVSGSAFIGAFISISLVFGLAHARGSWNPTRLLLTGVVIAAGWGATINFILSISPEKQLKGMLFWLMGDISNITPDIAGLLVLLTGIIISFILARQLNVLSQGDLQASALGVSVKSLRMSLFLLASALTAVAVTQAGSIGFVGLVVPHIIRLISGSDHRLLIPASVLLGGSLLVISDTLARTIIAPQQLPVGVITAFLGVPFFLFLLNRSPRAHGSR